MQLTGKQIVENKIITKFCTQGIQQQGLDVRVKNIRMLENGAWGFVPKEGKTVTPSSVGVLCVNRVYILSKGYYEVEFEEGCDIPNNCAMYFKTRSSLVRCGAEILSGQFDAGFKTDNMGAFLKVNIPIKIEQGARLAQAIITETYRVDDENLYNGQWQGDKQRN